MEKGVTRDNYRHGLFMQEGDYVQGRKCALWCSTLKLCL